jgi:amino acid transporter
VVLLGLGFAAMAAGPPANTISWRAVVPDLSKVSELNLWASVAFAFAGLELGATMSDEVRDPTRTLPRSVLVSAPVIMTLYLVGTLSVLWLVPASEVNVVSGFLQAINAGTTLLGTASLGWLVIACALLYVMGNLGGVGAWLAGPARVAFVIGLDRYFPPAFGRIHPRWKTPHVAILVQASIATVFLFLSVLGQGTTVAKAYLILLDTMLLVYFIPYVYLFLTYIVEGRRRPNERAYGAKVWLVGLSGLGLTLFAMVVACIPPGDTSNVLLFEAKVIGGALAFVLVGGVFYLRGRGGRTPI